VCCESKLMIRVVAEESLGHSERSLKANLGAPEVLVLVLGASNVGWLAARSLSCSPCSYERWCFAVADDMV
jgi:hypothetical protein